MTFLPYASTAAGFAEGWGTEAGLLVLFLLGPITSVALMHYGKDRIGSIFFLSLMPASAFAQFQYLVPLFGDIPAQNAAGWLYVYGAMLGLLGCVDIAASVVAFVLLRAVHQGPNAGDA